MKGWGRYGGSGGRSYRKPRAAGQGSRRGFGTTWWGKAWVQALTDRARLDPNRLSRGRSYARSGAVGELTVSVGEVRADVQGSRRMPYQVRVRVRQLDAMEWDRLFDAMAGQLGHAAALLDGELPPEVERDAAGAGVELLPGPGELGPRCSCPDWADPCKHSAAVCYLVADRLDADPFGLLLLRGRDRESVLAELRVRRGGAPPDAPEAGTSMPPVDQGVPAAEAYARWADAPGASEPPALPLPPPHPGRPTPFADGAFADDLAALASDAAARAWSLATGVGPDTGTRMGGVSGSAFVAGVPAADADAVAEADADADLARIAAAALGTPRLYVIARRVGMTSHELTRRAIAWQHGGSTGVAVLLGGQVAPDRGDIEAAKLALAPEARSLDARVIVRGGRVTVRDRQLRYGPDGLWYPLCKRRATWELAGAPDADPAAAARRAVATT